jgi:predicted acyltransferase
VSFTAYLRFVRIRTVNRVGIRRNRLVTATGGRTLPAGAHSGTAITSGMIGTPMATRPRVLSIDAFRGLVMLLMLAEALRLWTLADAYPGNPFWTLVAFNTTHVPWQGCSLHDLIQPAFSFLVGAVLPFSIASRRAAGQSFARMFAHVVWRSVFLILLGIFLRSLDRRQTYWTFEDTLTQIGLGYTFLFLLAFASLRVQALTFAAIFIGFWAAFVIYPAPAPGLLAHFNKNTNVSWAFDVWFLNLFPRETPFRFNSGGWSTLSFIPTLATMMLGVWTGEWLKRPQPAENTFKGLLAAGVVLTLGGLALDWLEICPIVKRIWTSSYTLFSGGLVVAILAVFYGVLEIKGWRRWAFPLLVIGANSIVVYVMSWTMEAFVRTALVRHLGHAPFAVLGAPFEPALEGAAVLLVFWLILYWMYRRRVFVRI